MELVTTKSFRNFQRVEKNYRTLPLTIMDKITDKMKFYRRILGFFFGKLQVLLKNLSFNFQYNYQ
jgi:hypothetical protein